MTRGSVIALIDGEHHPPAVREALDELERSRGLGAVLFCGGEEKVGADVLADPERHYGRPVLNGRALADALRELAAELPATAVVDLADEPVLGPTMRLELAALALHLGLTYEAPGLRLEPPIYPTAEFDGPVLSVIGTGKRTGKTAVAGHWAGLIRDAGGQPVIVSMGRGGPSEPQVADADTTLEDLRALAAAGRHAASDYLEDAVVAGVRTVGCRRVGGGPLGQPAESNLAEGVAVAAGLRPDTLILEGSGACVPPLRADRTVCVVGGPVNGLDRYRTLRADLLLLMGEWDVEGRAIRCELRPEPVDPLPSDARIALFTTGAERCDGVEPVVASANLARRAALEADLDRAAAQRCDVYLTELKAAAIDTVAARAEVAGARVAFVRNRPVGLDADLDLALLELHADA
jgi:cyclic 2,3-diphosphoglycerate synthetase